MNLLLDACIWGGERNRFTAAGHDCVWAGDWEQDPGDEVLLSRAVAEGRVVVTLDKDFGELAVLKRQRHCGILRLVGLRAREQVDMILRIGSEYADELEAGALITAARDRVRVRPPESPREQP